MNLGNSRFLEPGAPEWRELLSHVAHDFYHVPGYVALSANDAQGEATAFLFESPHGIVLLPLILRRIDDHLSDRGTTSDIRDASSPYGYPGPLIHAHAPEERTALLREAIPVLVEALRSRSIVACFVRLHPLLTVPMEPLSSAGAVVHHGQTVSIDLTGSADEIWRQTRGDHRRNINKAARDGLRVRIDETWSHLDDFVDLYTGTMTRVNAGAGYFFSKDYFLALRAALGTALSLCIAEFDGRVIAAGLFTEVNGIVQYHLSGADEDYRALRPMKALLHFARLWAKERGNRVLHLGGGVGGNADPLFDFKAGFSDIRHDFYTWRVIADPRAYRQLTARWEARHGERADRPDGYFPAYRKSP